ncbi:MAG: AAA family ATPase [Immundisolibacter sp.]|uniref:AAA family ATPase n=1 Tax=Immundisolibacter sp. TaxID=1934948 RepID=UPI003D0A39FD
MLLTDGGLASARFEPMLAAALGNGRGEEGCHVLVQAITRGSTRVDHRDWLFCLARTPGTWMRKRLVDAAGQSADDFIAGIQAGLPPGPAATEAPPLRLTRACATAEVLAMLQRAEALTAQAQRAEVVDAVLSLAWLDSAPARLLELIEAWTSAQDLAAFRRLLEQQVRLGGAAPELFDARGQLQRRLFSASGRRFCDRLVEDAASLGIARIGTRHLLYSLLGDERGLLARTLTAFGVDVAHDLHAALCRELARPGRKRVERFELGRDSLYDAVSGLLAQAQQLAAARGSPGIGEQDLATAFVLKQEAELARLLAGQRGVSLTALREQMQGAEAQDEEEDEGSPLTRVPPKEIEQQINRRILGEGHAVARVMPWIERLRFGIPRDGRPAAVFLFLGPTGTGKTQLAKELARWVFGDEEQLVFLEMGQFKTKESMNMFIGAAPGYVGYGEGKLTNGLRDRPHSVVLFDEIEKADTQVFDALLRFADEGVISDPAGPVRDGRQCIIVMTTNAGQTWLRGHLRERPAALDDPDALAGQLFGAAMDELAERGFRPEFLGRVDERITFLPLTPRACRQIVDQVLERELDKFRRLKEVHIDVHDDARERIARRAHARSLEEGARGVPRAINDEIVGPAIRLLVERHPDAGTVEGARLVATAFGADGVKVELL